MKPLIGINLDIEEGRPTKASIQELYYDAILKAGGIPVLLPPMPDQDLKDLLNQLHGLMLIGGNDYDPGCYGEQPCDSVEVVAPARQDFDLRLIQTAIRQSNVPVLGICAGLQLLNIGLGGSLIQDIPSSHPSSPVTHTSKNGWNEGFTRHDVKIDQDSRLASIYKTSRVEVPTSHHQAVRQLGEGLRAVAYADDGIIEAVELDQRNFTIGVQWHPERDFEGNRNLFVEFIREASGTSRKGA